MSRSPITASQIDDLLVEFAASYTRELPPQDEIRLDTPTYEVLDSALTMLRTARNEQVATVHKSVAEHLGVPWYRRRDMTGLGYAPVQRRPIDRLAAVEYVRHNPHTLVGALALGHAIEHTKQDRRFMARIVGVMEPTRGAALVQRHASKVTAHGAGQPMSRFLPRLYTRAMAMSKLHPHTEDEDTLAVGLFGAYMRAWDKTGRDPLFEPVIRRIVEQQQLAVDDVRKDKTVRELARNLRGGDVSGLNRQLGRLSLERLSLRYGALLGRPLKPWSDESRQSPDDTAATEW